VSDWRRPTPSLQDDDLAAADRLLDQANALLRRHRGTEVQPGENPALDSDDLPILTDVVDDSDPALPLLHEAEPLPPPPFTALAPAAPATPLRPAPDPDALAERLVQLDTALNREIEQWVSTEFPQILGRELDRLSTRMQAEMIAHLRAVLLPELSERISHLLDQTQESAGGDIT
jgi:hypothetical protein